jgi:hypothetical protein
MKEHKNDKIIAELYKKFDLTSDDVFTKLKKGTDFVIYRIINRRGIDKIEAKSKAKLEWKHDYVSDDYVLVDIVASKLDENAEEITFHTNGEADRKNVQQQPVYLAAMALARAKSRAILGIENFYKYGFFSEVEAEQFQDEVKEHNRRSSSIKTEGIKIPSELSFSSKK